MSPMKRVTLSSGQGQAACVPVIMGSGYIFGQSDGVNQPTEHDLIRQRV